MSVCAILLNWNDAPGVLNVVQALNQNRAGIKTIYVVDNLSTDDSLAKLAALPTNCRLIKNLSNSGYAGGNNLGLKAAFEDGHSAAVIFNTDVQIALPEKFSSLIETVVAECGLSVLGISVIDPLTELPYFPSPPSRTIRLLLESLPTNKRWIGGIQICGGAIVVPKTLYRSIGGFREEFFMYCEETEYLIRASEAGARVICDPQFGRVYRGSGRETRKLYVFYYQARNLTWICMRHSAYPLKTLAILACAISSIKEGWKSYGWSGAFAASRGILHAIRGIDGKDSTKSTAQPQ